MMEDMDTTQADGGGRENAWREFVLDPQSKLFPTDLADIDEGALKGSYRRLQLIYELGRAVCGETQVDTIFRVVVRSLARLLEVERCFAATCDEDGRLNARASHNIDVTGDPEGWPVSRTILQRVLTEGMALLSADALHDDQFDGVLSIDAHQIRAVMCVPLGTPGNCEGLIYADNTCLAETFGQGDLQFLTALAHFTYIALRNAREIARITAQRELSNQRLATLQAELIEDHHIVGKNTKLLDAYRMLRKAAKSDVPILILGETGTGKELFAKAAHNLSERADNVFMRLNMAALSEDLVESELFGHERGAFTGAVRDKTGRLALADGGTLFLDEVADIPLKSQPKLLRVLETGEFERLGGIDALHTDVRLVSATHKNLAQLVESGDFREDLFYRLSGIQIQIPPLRERTEDIPLLVERMLTKRGSAKAFSDEALERLQSYSWPGNVRQLQHLVEVVDVVCESETVGADDLRFALTPEVFQKDSGFVPLKELVAQVERDHIRRALAISGGNKQRAIDLLGISRSKFFERLKEMSE